MADQNCSKSELPGHEKTFGLYGDRYCKHCKEEWPCDAVTACQQQALTVDRIPALLEPIQNRLEVITPGPWTDWDRGIGHEIHDQYGEPINSGHRETFSARDAEFIANAPTDQARLLAAIQAVVAETDAWLASEPIEGTEPSQLWYSAGKKHGALKLRAAIESALSEAS
jgi:hypothetical protein